GKTPGGGRSGIRTHGGPKTSTAFEAVPFVRSGILPAGHVSEATCSDGPTLREEACQLYRRLLGPHTVNDRWVVVPPRVRAHAVERLRAARLQVSRAVPEP